MALCVSFLPTPLGLYLWVRGTLLRVKIDSSRQKCTVIRLPKHSQTLKHFWVCCDNCRRLVYKPRRMPGLKKKTWLIVQYGITWDTTCTAYHWQQEGLDQLIPSLYPCPNLAKTWMQHFITEDNDWSLDKCLAVYRKWQLKLWTQIQSKHMIMTGLSISF